MAVAARACALAILCLLLATLPLRAQTLLRDPDIEYALKQMMSPLATAAGLSASRIDVLVIKDDRMNAFIMNDRTVFIHSGLILRVDDAAELQAVIAHELAHIANGHITRRISNAGAAGRASMAGIALGIAAAIVGGGDVGAGVAAGVSESARRAFLGHTLAEEAAADSSGLRYMAEAGIDPHATVRLLDKFRGQEILSESRRAPYVRSHPLTRDRLRAVKGLAAGLRVADIDDKNVNYWFLRARGKLSAFLRPSGWTMRQVGNSGGTDIDIMRRAIAYHRRPDTKAARAEIDRLVALLPEDPFVHELRGQILLESRDVAGAVDAYRRAADFAPSNALILAGLGRAHLAKGDYDQALEVLTKARARDRRDPRLLRDLALAHAKSGNNGEASLATAERYALLGRREDAVLHANRAAGLLPRGSPGWRRAQDIIGLQDRR